MPLVITNTTKDKLPRLPFSKITSAVLGEKYDCSLVIINSKKSCELNRKHRGKNTATNILSFPLDRESGEIFIDLKQARADAPLFDRPYKNFIGFLFIHGLCHLKGFVHSSKMEIQEKKICFKFKL